MTCSSISIPQESQSGGQSEGQGQWGISAQKVDFLWLNFPALQAGCKWNIKERQVAR